MRIAVDLDDNIADACEQDWPDSTWAQAIAYGLSLALDVGRRWPGREWAELVRIIEATLDDDDAA